MILKKSQQPISQQNPNMVAQYVTKTFTFNFLPRPYQTTEIAGTWCKLSTNSAICIFLDESQLEHLVPVCVYI